MVSFVSILIISIILNSMLVISSTKLHNKIFENIVRSIMMNFSSGISTILYRSIEKKNNRGEENGEEMYKNTFIHRRKH
jgi:hypothetical protein